MKNGAMAVFRWRSWSGFLFMLLYFVGCDTVKDDFVPIEVGSNVLFISPYFDPASTSFSVNISSGELMFSGYGKEYSLGEFRDLSRRAAKKYGGDTSILLTPIFSKGGGGPSLDGRLMDLVKEMEKEGITGVVLEAPSEE